MALQSEAVITEVAVVLAASCAAYLAATCIVAALRDAASRARRLGRGRKLPLLGLTLVMASPAYASSKLELASSRRSHLSPEPPWSGRNGSPPPRLLLRTKAPSLAPSRSHPAIHRVGAGRYRLQGPLFARAGKGAVPAARGDVTARAGSRSLDRSMAAHPAGKATRASSRRPPHAMPGEPARRYTVMDGDSLWSIAAGILHTEDASRIARYWPRIHAANRSVIGRDPNLVFPGQDLHLPPESE